MDYSFINADQFDIDNELSLSVGYNFLMSGWGSSVIQFRSDKEQPRWKKLQYQSSLHSTRVFTNRYAIRTS